jgi:hypothetical protein
MFRNRPETHNEDSPEVAVIIGILGSESDMRVDCRSIFIKFPLTKEFKRYSYSSYSGYSNNTGSCNHLSAKKVVDEEGRLDGVYMDYDDKMMLLRMNYETSTTFFFLERTEDVYTNDGSYTFGEFPTDIYAFGQIVSPRADLYYFTYRHKYTETYEEPMFKSVDFSGEFPVIESYEVIRHDVYRDGGTTDIIFKDNNGQEHRLHIPTPFQKDRISTFDDTALCRIIDRFATPDEYEEVTERLSKACGLKIFKELKDERR